MYRLGAVKKSLPPCFIHLQLEKHQLSLSNVRSLRKPGGSSLGVGVAGKDQLNIRLLEGIRHGKGRVGGRWLVPTLHHFLAV